MAFRSHLFFISTVAVYGCDSGENITEEYPLNGTTPYALSKNQGGEISGRMVCHA